MDQPGQSPAPARTVARRQAVLAELRARLTGPQPAPKRVRRPRQHVTDLEPGDVLSFTVGAETALFRVLRVDRDRTGTVPVVGWLDWEGTEPPDGEAIRRLAVRVQDDVDLARYDMPRAPRPLIDRLLTPMPRGKDWRAAGFVLAARVPPVPEDATRESWGGMHWESLAFDIVHRLGGHELT
ncbi:hypothetical protein [Nocardioides sp. CER19]|uniref:hypothetical protein n=1 Tax=Nocardioides sp. CER19 TaxID=3038538 RepID=UPI00244D4610|nr:hypothetical protein [Nocardioides sp. CER19]MDH2416490.1 hypothetical protein [Nocardioides sp. CER19]